MFTFPQARARFAETVVKSLEREEIVKRLGALGSAARAGDAGATKRQLAYRLAWVLLPADGVYVEPAVSDLCSYAVYNRSDAKTELQGGL